MTVILRLRACPVPLQAVGNKGDINQGRREQRFALDLRSVRQLSAASFCFRRSKKNHLKLLLFTQQLGSAKH